VVDRRREASHNKSLDIEDWIGILCIYIIKEGSGIGDKRMTDNWRSIDVMCDVD
jgi:hypothetical protein